MRPPKRSQSMIADKLSAGAESPATPTAIQPSGTSRALGAQSAAYGINKLAQIVREGRDSTNARRATIWLSPGGTGKIFDTSTGHASIARKINDNGTVVGDATVTVNFVSSNRAVVWVPQPVVSHRSGRGLLRPQLRGDETLLDRGVQPRRPEPHYRPSLGPIGVPRALRWVFFAE